MKNTKFIANAFSIQMLNNLNATVSFKEINPADIPRDVVSAIGHPDTAAVVGDALGITLKPDRVNVKLDKGDTLFVAQLMGGRLPEGATTLPDGFSFKFLRVTVM